MSKEKAELYPAYVFYGENRLKRDALQARMRERLEEEEGDLSFDSVMIDAKTSNASQILNALQTIPFVSNKRLVTVMDADKLKDKDSKAIADYLSDPNDTSILVLVADKFKESSALFKAVKSCGSQTCFFCPLPKKDALEQLVQRMASTHGASIEPAATKLLIEMIGEDPVKLDIEVGKMALATEGGSITVAMVRKMVERITEPKIYNFLDAFAGKDLAASLRIRSGLKSMGAVNLISSCVRKLRDLSLAKSADASGEDAIATIQAVTKCKPYPAKKLLECSRKWSDEQIGTALLSAAFADSKMKTGEDAELVFQIWLVDALGKKGKGLV